MNSLSNDIMKMANKNSTSKEEVSIVISSTGQKFMVMTEQQFKLLTRSVLIDEEEDPNDR